MFRTVTRMPRVRTPDERRQPVGRRRSAAGGDQGAGHAVRLVQIVSVRDLSNISVNQGMYVPMCDHRGVLINDPVVLKLAENHFWRSIADNNVLVWVRAIASERGLRVDINEPDVLPMAVQEPMAEDVVAATFGDWVRKIGFFWFVDAELDGIPVKLVRSGYSMQGGFEFYLMDGSRGVDLWNIVREAGRPWGIGLGCPYPTERIEGGLLSFGGDTDDLTNPFEVRLGKYVDLGLDDDVIGIKALRAIRAEGATRHLLGVILDNQPRHPGHPVWNEVHKDGSKVGHMTNGVWSFRRRTMVGFALVSTDVHAGDRVEVLRNGKRDAGTIRDLPFPG